MSEGATEEDIPRLAITSATDDAGIAAVIERDIQRPEVGQNGDNIGIGHDSSLLIKAHASGDQTFALVQKFPVEILAEIFVQCIPPLVLHKKDNIFPPVGYGRELQRVRSSLGQVCPTWNIVLNEEPRAWTTLVFDDLLPTPDILSVWIKKSKSCPLDVMISRGHPQGDSNEVILKLLHQEFWRIRSLIGGFHVHWNMDPWPLWALFPIDEPTVAPMLQKLTLLHDASNGGFGRIHCPQIHTLSLWTTDDSIKSLVDKPMLNTQRLSVLSPKSPITWHFRLLEALPNLVSMAWNLYEPNDTELPAVPVVLQHLKYLTISSNEDHSARLFLRSLIIPSLEYLDFAHYYGSDIDQLNEALDILSEKGTIRLRHLILRNTSPMRENVSPVLNHLMHLETLKLTLQNRSVDAMLIALSPHNRDFSSACPKLKEVELSSVNVSVGTLIEFVERRVQSDLEESAPGLVTWLELSGIYCIDEGLCSRFAETHSSSVHLFPEEDNDCKFF